MSELWNIRRLCQFFGVTRQTIYRWMKLGKLPQPVKRYGSPRWDAEELRKSIKSDG